MYILLNESGFGSESGFGPEFNSSSESYVISRNTTDDSYNESNSPVKWIHILILIFICLVCVIIPFFFDDMMYFFFNIKSKCRTINWCSCKKCSIKPKIEPIFDDCHSTDTDMCTICLSVNNNKSVTLRCDHRFHEVCIKHWVDVSLKKYNNVPCPLCRKNIFV
jgi:hypothetical protein